MTRAPSATGTLPDFLIVGAMKSGTNTLYSYLCQHPDVRRARVHEVHFFDNNFHRGVGWYRDHFPARAEAEARWFTGETSPYYLFHPAAPGRAAAVVPDARIIVVLRNPADRAYSHFQHERAMGRETCSFAEALDREPERTNLSWRDLVSGRVDASDAVQHFSYLARGDYAVQLERWFACFPKEQVTVIRAEDLYGDPMPVMRNLFAFVGLDPFEALVNQRLNGRGYRPLDPLTRHRLNEHFREPVRRLGALLGGDQWWDL